jgi:CDP-glucose 4,6-dehydratase
MAKRSGIGNQAVNMTISPSQFWLDRPTFVTGGTGLLGNCLVDRLLSLGADVVCLVRDWVPKSELIRSSNIERVKVIRGDICDQKLLERVLAEYEINTVFHLAAQTIVSIANRHPVSTFETNIQGTWSLLEACRLNPTVKQIVLASSDKAYGDQVDLPYNEDTPLQGQHPYDVSKSCADLIAQTYAISYGLPVSVTRCGNLYGRGDLNWNRIIPGTIRSVLRDQRPIIRSDGHYIRDYFYVEDAAAAYMLLAEKMAEKPELRELRGHAFNFSTGTPTAVLELVNCILNLMESELEPEIRNEASNEIRAQYLDATKAQTMLDWKANFSLADGLTKTIDWYKEFFQNSQL